MPTIEFPSGAELVFESPEALVKAVANIKAGTPVVVRSDRTGETRGRVGP